MPVSMRNGSKYHSFKYCRQVNEAFTLSYNGWEMGIKIMIHQQTSN